MIGHMNAKNVSSVMDVPCAMPFGSFLWIVEAKMEDEDHDQPMDHPPIH